jgi:glycosyltransferase involved in cell wall biosynthesis
MNAPPEVTVLIPTRNRSALVRTALAAALRQEDVELEVVVVDDGSSDETPSVLAEVVDPRVRVLRHDERRGVAQARNTGIAHARGEWVAFLDDDDLWAPRKLRKQLDEAVSEGAEFVYAGAVLLDEHRRAIETFPAPHPADVARNLLQSYAIPAGASNVVAKTEVIRRLGGFDEALFHLDDWDLWLRLALAGPAAASREVLVGYLLHPRNRVLEDESDVMGEFRHLVEKHRPASSAHGVEFDRVAFSRWLAGGHRRAGRRFRAARVYASTAIACRDGGSAVRALAVLGGEGVMKARRRRSPPDGDGAAIPEWLALYR